MENKYIVEARLKKESGFNRSLFAKEMKWHIHSKYNSFADAEKAVKDLNKNHNKLMKFRLKIK
jgi:hypothetical protein